MERYEPIKRTYGEERFQKIWNSKVLVVGGGGIGCEILKNLALTGFRNIELIDLDTIDVSNLNRQFLFRPEHVGHSKAVVAGAAAARFNPHITVKSHHDNVKSAKFNTSYIAGFDVVLNALDNIDARRHVNRLCLAAEVPLIDSGTTGYLGQVTPILKGKTSCYECFPKPSQKVYPICTIRSTPDKPVHCIVWAKECFKLLFGNPVESMLFEDESTGDSSTYMGVIAYPAAATTATTTTTTAAAAEVDLKVQSLVQYGQRLLLALYGQEIDKRLQMGVYKTAKVVPAPLQEADISAAVQTATEILSHTSAAATAATAATVVMPSQTAGWDQRVFSLHEHLVEFLCSLYFADVSLLGQLSFDKDDIWAMKFVAAAANLRCHVFSIPQLSYHDAKGVAGNIIPAIATTNAIVAGIQVMQAVHLITNKDDAATTTTATGAGTSDNCNVASQQKSKQYLHAYCLRLPTRKGFYLQPSEAEPPEKACFVCGKAQLTLQIDVTEATLDDLVSKVLKKKLGFNEPSLMMGGSILYEEGEDCDEDLQQNLPLKLQHCPAGGIVDGCLLAVDDFSQKAEVQIMVKHLSVKELEKIDAAAVDLFVISGKEAFEKKQQQQQQQQQQQEEEETVVDGSASTADAAVTAGAKRDRDSSSSGGGGSKRQKVANYDADAVVELE